MDACEEKERLTQAAMATLRAIVDVTQRLIEANHSHNGCEVARLDKELELAVGEKERSFGALHQHEREHDC
jgi:hypothetical protein